MYIVVWANPKAKKERLTVREDGSLEIAVREPAERNLANARIREVVAEYFGKEKSNVRIVSGHRSGKKVISIDE